MADTRGLQEDELHKKSIATQIEKHVDSITAVLVVANGTVPRVTVSTKYALSTLAAIFPQTLANNVAILLTNASGPLHQNFSVDTLPGVLKAAPHFFLNNPISLERMYLKLIDDPIMKKKRPDFRRAVKAAEQETLEMLVDLFDWLDGLVPQPTADIVAHYQDTLILVEQVAAKKAKDSAVSY